jgi:hypothetical protein
MHDNPRATEHEQEIAGRDRRHEEEESMRYPEFHDPDEESRRAHGDVDSDADDDEGD